MCEGCKQREAVILATKFYCDQVFRFSGDQFEIVSKNLKASSSESLSKLIRYRARNELAKEILKAIQSEMEKWELNII